MTAYLLNLDDDHHGRTPAEMRHLAQLAASVGWPWCLVCGDWHHAGQHHTNTGIQLEAALVGVLEAVERATAPVTTCAGCGCLVRDLEVCPGCEAARLHHPGCPRRIDAGADCIGCDPLSGDVLPTGLPYRTERGSAAWGAVAILACFVGVVVVALILVGGLVDASQAARGHGCRNAGHCQPVKPTATPTPIAPGCVEYGPACVIDTTGTWPTTPPVVIEQTFPPPYELP